MAIDEHDRKVRALRARASLGQVTVDWGRAKEPTCVHSPNDATQPMSWCNVCQHSPKLAEWRAYWDGLLDDPANIAQVERTRI